MIASLLYRKNTPEERDVAHLFKELNDRQAEVRMIDVDTPEGQQMIELYDVMDFPAVLITDSQGSEMTRWQQNLPPASDISYWVHS